MSGSDPSGAGVSAQAQGVAPGAYVSADAVMEPGAKIAPGAIVYGDAHIGAATWIGTGAVVHGGTFVGRALRHRGRGGTREATPPAPRIERASGAPSARYRSQRR